MRTEEGKKLEQEIREQLLLLKDDLGALPERTIWFWRGYITGRTGVSKISFEDHDAIDAILTNMLDGKEEK